MKFAEIITAIEKIAPLWGAAPWDRSGIQVASSKDEFFRLAVFLDPTPQAISQALGQGADCMLSHHPLSLKPELPCKLDAWHEALRLLLGADAALYAAHTSLDVNLAGPSGWLGRELGLENTDILEIEHEPDQSWPDGLGYGQIGELASAMPFNEVASTVLGLLHLDNMILCGPRPGNRIKRLAYCPGSGASMLDKAVAKGAELFISGDIKYHAALDAEIAVLDVGHHSMEEEMMLRCAQLLRVKLPELEIIFIPSTSPFSFMGKNFQN